MKKQSSIRLSSRSKHTSHTHLQLLPLPHHCGPTCGYFTPQEIVINHGLLCMVCLSLHLYVHVWTVFPWMRLHWTHPLARSACDQLCQIALQRSDTFHIPTELSPSPLTRILNCFVIFADPICESWYLMVVLINISFLIIVWSWTSLLKSVVQHLQSCMGIPSSVSSLGSKLRSRVEPSVSQGTFFKVWQN